MWRLFPASLVEAAERASSPRRRDWEWPPLWWGASCLLEERPAGFAGMLGDFPVIADERVPPGYVVVLPNGLEADIAAGESLTFTYPLNAQ